MAADGQGEPGIRTAGAASAGTPDLMRMIAAEALGSGLLAFIAVSAGILAERYAIHDLLLALFMTALGTSCAFFVLTRTLGDHAPALFNPSLALALALSGRLAYAAAILSASAQIAAAFLGVMIAHLVTNTGLVQTATQIHTGENVWAGEFVASALFVFAMLAVTGRTSRHAPLTGAACLLAIALATPSLSLANPALTLARGLTDSFLAIRLEDAVVIAAIQIAAALAAWLLWRWFADQSGANKP
ncbi:MAG: aquaporin [Rhodomicrobiaceae bacterium]